MYCKKSFVISQQLFVDAKGGNVNGVWFTVPSAANVDINVNIKEGTEDGKKVLVLEQRTPMAPTNEVMMSLFKIYKDRYLVKSSSVINIKGQNPLINKTFEDVMKDSSLEKKGGVGSFVYVI